MHSQSLTKVPGQTYRPKEFGEPLTNVHFLMSRYLTHTHHPTRGFPSLPVMPTMNKSKQSLSSRVYPGRHAPKPPFCCIACIMPLHKVLMLMWLHELQIWVHKFNGNVCLCVCCMVWYACVSLFNACRDHPSCTACCEQDKQQQKYPSKPLPSIGDS